MVGKDITAAIFALLVLPSFHVLVEQKLAVNIILTSLNDYLYNLNTDNMFLSAYCLCIDLETGILSYSNAGHESPICYNHNNQLITLGPALEVDIVLGIVPHYQYHVKQINLNAFKSLYLFTDGISEARDARGNFYGSSGIKNLISTALTSETRSLLVCDQIIQESYNFELKAQHDDKTIIAINIF